MDVNSFHLVIISIYHYVAINSIVFWWYKPQLEQYVMEIVFLKQFIWFNVDIWHTVRSLLHVYTYCITYAI